MISAISVIIALITFVYIIVLGVSDLPNLVQVENKGIMTLHVAGFLMSFLLPLALIAFGIMY
ncbi:hypothetical protein HZY88_08315 [Aerococcaceae bacterium DSM 111176]|nr:hypothetical protein [Aerococcaceae bacterium DSM 111176]